MLFQILDPYCDPVVKAKKLHIEGLNVNRWSDWTQGLEQMKEWVLEVSFLYAQFLFFLFAGEKNVGFSMICFYLQSHWICTYANSSLEKVV